MTLKKDCKYILRGLACRFGYLKQLVRLFFINV